MFKRYDPALTSDGPPDLTTATMEESTLGDYIEAESVFEHITKLLETIQAKDDEIYRLMVIIKTDNDYFTAAENLAILNTQGKTVDELQKTMTKAWTAAMQSRTTYLNNEPGTP